MTFNIDFSQYKIIDLSKLVIPNIPTPDDRPFAIQEGKLDDGTAKFDILKTHTHVGTHVESPRHFYPNGKSITDLSLEHFMGKARLFHAKPAADIRRITLADVQSQLEQYRGTFEILLIRSDSGFSPIRFAMETVPYIRDLQIKLLIFEAGIEFGNGIEEGRRFHDLLLSRDICLVEFPDHCQELDRDEFYIFAAPIKVQGLDSGMCRLFAVLEK